jgi:hypothetical protein
MLWSYRRLEHGISAVLWVMTHGSCWHALSAMTPCGRVGDELKNGIAQFYDESTAIWEVRMP